MHDYSHNNLPLNFDYFQTNKQIHTHNTRQANKFHLPLPPQPKSIKFSITVLRYGMSFLNTSQISQTKTLSKIILNSTTLHLTTTHFSLRDLDYLSPHPSPFYIHCSHLLHNMITYFTMAFRLFRSCPRFVYSHVLSS